MQGALVKSYMQVSLATYQRVAMRPSMLQDTQRLLTTHNLLEGKCLSGGTLDRKQTQLADSSRQPLIVGSDTQRVCYCAELWHMQCKGKVLLCMLSRIWGLASRLHPHRMVRGGGGDRL